MDKTTPPPPKLGALVTLQGRVHEYRDRRQVQITCIMEESDPNAEWIRMLETLKYLRIYSTSLERGRLKMPENLDDQIQALVRANYSTSDVQEPSQESFQDAFDKGLDTFMTETLFTRTIKLWISEKKVSSSGSSRSVFTFQDLASDPMILSLIHRVFECQVGFIVGVELNL
jgi:hypothetical protein